MTPAELLLTPDNTLATAIGSWRLTELSRIGQPTLSIPVCATPPHDLAAPPIVLDGNRIDSLDPSGAYCLISRLAAQGIAPERVHTRGFSAQHQAIFDLVREHYPASLRQQETLRGHRWQSLMRKAEQTERFLLENIRLIGILGTESVSLLRYPGRFRYREFTNQIESIFVSAIPLIALMMFLLGIVFAYLLGHQAIQYGANIFVVDGTTLAVCRELSPVLVAILVAGRSGSAITAQIGTMKFDEELDALRVMGLSPYQVLIIPRILALLVTLPLLVFVGDVTGILGSMLVASRQLGIHPAIFVDRMMSALDTETVIIGLSKAPVFALFIGLIASEGGLHVARNARSIGTSTTITVVRSIIAVIGINAVIAIALIRLDI